LSLGENLGEKKKGGNRGGLHRKTHDSAGKRKRGEKNRVVFRTRDEFFWDHGWWEKLNPLFGQKMQLKIEKGEKVTKVFVGEN